MDALGHVSSYEVRIALRSLYGNDPESNLRDALLRSLSDDLKPLDARGRWRPSPLLILISVLIAAMTVVFFYFTVGAAR